MQGYVSAFRFPHPPTPGQDREDPVPSFLLPWLPCRSLVIHSSPPTTGPQLESYLVPTLTALSPDPRMGLLASHEPSLVTSGFFCGVMAPQFCKDDPSPGVSSAALLV